MSAVTAARSRALAIPAWVWLTGIVAVSIAARVVIGRRMVAPWIMVDEIVYSELAKNVAAHGEFLVRGVPSHGYGFVYPVLIAPAWALFGSIPSAYAAAKAINAVAMSLAAVPAYFLARRILPERLALLAAGLTVLVPSMLYTGVLMTENAFYPLFLIAALAARGHARAADRCSASWVCSRSARSRSRRGRRRSRSSPPSPRRRFCSASSSGAASAGRSVPSRGSTACSAPALCSRWPGRSLAAARRSASSAPTEPPPRRATRPSGILRFFLYHVAGLDLAIGVLPFAALLAMWLAPRRPTPAARAFTVASLAISVWLVAEVAAFASASYVDRIEERNMFYLAPFALIALLGLCGRRRGRAFPEGHRDSRSRRGRAAGLHPLRPLHHHERAERHASSSCPGGGRRTT